jgi:mycofactocin system transcriptional regulator
MSRAAVAESEPLGLGRPQVTSRAELENISLAMFSAHGFELTSVDEIAAAAGIGRRTFFRYFKSKNDAVWGDFDAELERFAQWFDDCPPEVPILSAIRDGVLEFNSFDQPATASLRDRMRIILSSPALQAYSTLRYRAWRQVIVGFSAARLGVSENDLVPRALGHLALAAALAAYEQWLACDDSDLIAILGRSLSLLGSTELGETQ